MLKFTRTPHFSLFFSTSTLRVPTSFRLSAELLEELKECAKATNSSLNNYVESILMDFMNKNKTMEENVITPDLQAKLDKSREEHKKGETLCFDTAQDAIAWMEAL